MTEEPLLGNGQISTRARKLIRGNISQKPLSSSDKVKEWEARSDMQNSLAIALQ